MIRKGAAVRDEAPALELRGVGKWFGKGDGRTVALRGVDLDMRAGEFLSIVGPSGCGKSTLLRIVADLIEPSEGSVRVKGRTARQARENRDLGVVFQTPVLYEWRSVSRNVQLPLEVMGFDAAERGGCWSWSACRGSPSTRCGSSPAACSSGSRSPGRCRSTPRCC